MPTFQSISFNGISQKCHRYEIEGIKIWKYL